ncbi:hypothetical protein BpHYR1_012483 [Brachionus plicatilis]|uniref:Uncharacterized protein n=1 Tax=Brachionus plicatilis TaxID=10195 RepID=A0A3M7SW47_BRAPC|nr:hypothetical protein BpHYR1_012483 [Brachionus plicatilis]
MKKILILDQSDRVEFEEAKKIRLLHLRHPKEGEKVPFFVHESTDGINLYEMMNYAPENSCVFVDDYIQADTFIYFLTKFNLGYFVIDYLTNSDQFEFESELDFKKKLFNFLTESSIDEELLKKINFPEIGTFLDLAKSDSTIEITLNNSKCYEWLKAKISKISNLMASLSDKKNENNEDNFKQDAFDLLSQYLNRNISAKLRKELGISSPLGESSSENKRAKQQIVTIE